MGDLTCGEAAELVPELALGVLSGQERDDALRHIEGCADCRGELEAFSRVGDELLRTVPSLEPPSGFEERVLARIATPRLSTGVRRWMLAVAAVAALVVGAGVTYGVGAHDRRLAREYGEVLGTLHGTSLRSAVLRDTRGVVDGQVVAYEGRPSWIFVAVEHGNANGDMTIRLVGRTTRTVHGLHVARGHGAFGGVVSGDVRDVRAIELVSPSGSVVLRAAFDHHI